MAYTVFVEPPPCSHLGDRVCVPSETVRFSGRSVGFSGMLQPSKVPYADPISERPCPAHTMPRHYLSEFFQGHLQKLTFRFPSFFTEALRIGTPNYIPTETDVLRARATSRGISETRFSLGPLS